MKGKRKTRIWIATGLAILSAASVGPTAQAAASHPLNLHALGKIAWYGRRYATASGAGVKVLVSPAYASDSGAGQRWAEFFDSLVHGAELSLLTAYIAPLDEVQTMCNGTDVLGCYEGDRLVTIGEPAVGISPQSVAAHEYGHHVAYNRVNPPWVAVDWGTKRWATYENVCARTASRTAFPGDEGLMYSLNPGEAFAESYRVLNGYGVDDWSIVDPSFRPDAPALSLLRQDVVDPWASAPTRIVSGRFRGGRSWTLQVPTPLDGSLDVQVTPGADSLSLLSSDGRTTLSQGTWGTNGAKTAGYVVCGQRTVLIRITRNASSRRFRLRISEP
jgi:hypothetical protein